MPALAPFPTAPSSPRPDDDVVRAARGDVAAFERLYRAHVARIHSLARRMAGPAAADELTQDAFVRAWQKIGTFRGDAAFGTWLYRLAVNVIIERFRSQRAELARWIDNEPVFAVAAGHSTSPTLRMGLDAALEHLPDGARRIFVLHDVEGYKHAEIGTLLGISAGTSKAQLHRARMLLRRHL
jgi:RNA polymerase sigma-70 factor (ECF subfamily)